jgi:capsular polysaccharide biosynthesis protein
MTKPFQRITGGLLLATGLALVAAGVWQLILPNQYQARARISYEPIYEEATTYRLAHPGSFDGDFDRAPKELVIFQPLVLSNATVRLRLNEKPSDDQGIIAEISMDNAIELLRRQIHLQNIRNTALYDVFVVHESPEQAANIANAIVEAFQARRTEQERQAAIRGFAILKVEEKELEQERDRALEQVEQLKRELGISKSEPDEQSDPNLASYFQAKRKADEISRFLKLLSQKIIAETEFLNSRKAARKVEIIDRAEPPSRPIRPNRRLGAAMLIGGLGLSVFGIWLLAKKSSL